MDPTVTDIQFWEASAAPDPVSLPLSHVSIELGHLYMDDFVGGLPVLSRMLQQVAPWAEAARATVSTAMAPTSVRASTCFLVDEYFSTLMPPTTVVPMLLEAATSAGLTIDYLARESGCADANDVPVADLVLHRLVADPPPGTNGSRPPTEDTGWLCNGVRATHADGSSQAMKTPAQWRPPSENGLNRHSTFIDVELWSQEPEGRVWSCAFLAAVWQLLRLGVLRAEGKPVSPPQTWAGELPPTWAELPPIIQLNPRARPFAAYRTFTALPNQFLTVEAAVKTILSQVGIEQGVHGQIHKRASAEGIELPDEIVDRIEYAFVAPSWR